MKTVHTMPKSLQIKVYNSTQIAFICLQVACNLLCGDWSPHRSPRSAHLKKNFKMSNFAPCGPIFKIRNSKLVYSKSYKQIADYIFLITSTFRLLLYYFVHFYTQRNRIWKNQHCSPTVQCPHMMLALFVSPQWFLLGVLGHKICLLITIFLDPICQNWPKIGQICQNFC